MWILFVCVTSVILGTGAAILLSLESLRNLFLNLVPALVLAVGAVAIRRQEGSWLSPGAFFPLTWTALVWASLLLAPNVAVSPMALWFVVIACAAVYAGSAAGHARPLRQGGNAPLERFKGLPWLRTLVMVATITGLSGVMVLLQAKGGGLGTLVSGVDLGAIARGYSVDRYVYRLSEPLLATALSTGTYLGAFLGGCLLARADAKNRWIGLLPLVPAFGQAAVLTTKASVAYTLAILASSYLATRLAVPRPRKTTNWSTRIPLAALLALLVAAVSLLTQLSRYGYSIGNLGQVGETLRILQVSALGYLGGFSAWLQTPLHLSATLPFHLSRGDASGGDCYGSSREGGRRSRA